MKRAFIFSITVIMLFALLLTVLYASEQIQSPFLQIEQILSTKKLNYVYNNVDSNIPTILKLSIYQNSNNLTISDVLPNTDNITQNLQGYSSFLNSYYPSQFAQVSFNPALDTLNPPITFNPMGINYTYPDWSKKDLTVYCPSGNGCNYVNTLVLNITLLNDTFVCNPSNSSSCNSNQFNWSPSPNNCQIGTAGCVGLILQITDKLNETYFCPNNLSGNLNCPYYSFSWDSSNSPKITFPTNESSNCKFRLILGGSNLFDVSMLDSSNNPCGFISLNTTFSFNSSSYSVNDYSVLSVNDTTSNQSLSGIVSN